MKLRIRDLREDKDFTQKQIAEFLMCDQSLYSKYERGERALPLEYAGQLAGFYHTSIDYLVGLTDEKEPYPSRNAPPNRGERSNAALAGSSKIDKIRSRRKLGCTSTRSAERHPQGVCRIRKAAELPTAAQQRIIGESQVV